MLHRQLDSLLLRLGMQPVRVSRERIRYCQLLILIETDSGLDIPAYNQLGNVENPCWGAVLPKPFPWTVSQEVILVSVIINNKLQST
jgi:hypothetical protein